MRCPRGRFPEQPPSTNELRGPRRGFVPGTNKRPRVSTVKNTHSKPSCHRTGTTTKHFPHQTQPDACPRNGPGLPAHPPQSGGQPPHLPLLPRTGVKKPTRRQDSKSHESFFLSDLFIRNIVSILTSSWSREVCKSVTTKLAQDSILSQKDSAFIAPMFAKVILGK